MEIAEFSIERWCKEVKDLFKSNESYGIYAANDASYIEDSFRFARLRSLRARHGHESPDFVEGREGPSSSDR